MNLQYVPVISSTGIPLMPCHPARARQLVRKGKALRRFDRGLFYIKLLERADGVKQLIGAGIDPGAKKEAITLKSAKRTFLNIQADAVTWVSQAETTSTQMRRTRRGRHTPYRPCRANRRQGQFKLPPSIRARWNWKLRLCTWLARYYPIATFMMEDIKARTIKHGKKWNKFFSILEAGKHWFYARLGVIAQVVPIAGWVTADERTKAGLVKSSSKLSDSFSAHCVDSFILATMFTLGSCIPDNTRILYITPLRFHRRQLHRLQPVTGGLRAPYGGTRSLGFKRGTWVTHPRYGTCYVGGTSKGTISLHDLATGRRQTQKARPAECRTLCTASWRVRYA